MCRSYESTNAQRKNCNRGTALEQSVEKTLGSLNQFHLLKMSPLILMHFQIIND